MADTKFFIINAVLLVALVAGAAYLQKTYDTDHKPEVSAATIATSTEATDGWHLVTAPASAAPATAAPADATVAAPVPVAAPAPKPAVHRVYNREGDDD